MGHGDCDNDSECSGDLVCGTDNCQDFNPVAQRTADCCKDPASVTTTTYPNITSIAVSGKMLITNNH